jgi:hypothetical protein
MAPTRTIQAAQQGINAIVKVARVNNTLHFMSARNLDIPKKVIVTENLKSVEVLHCMSGSYTLLFNYFKDTEYSERVHLDYFVDQGISWEEDAKKVVNEAVRLV